MGWARKTGLVPALMVRVPEEDKNRGLVDEPMLPDALKVMLPAVIRGSVVMGTVVRIDPADAVRVRLVVAILIETGSVMSPFN